MTEVDRCRVATMLAADAKFDVGARGTATLDGDLIQFADALEIERNERVLDR